MAMKVYEESKIVAIAEKIREKTGNDTTYKTSEMPSGIDKVYDAGNQAGYDTGYTVGKKAQYDAFWDAFQNYGNRRYYYYAFAWVQKKDGWATDAYNPKYPIIADTVEGGAYSTQSLFHYSSVITDTKVPITLKNGAANNCFYRCYALKNIPSLTLENITSFNATFAECRALETLIVHGTIEADIDLHWSTKLSRESIDSIANALSTATSDLTLTLSKEAAMASYDMTEDDWGEFLNEVVMPHGNWSFALE